MTIVTAKLKTREIDGISWTDQPVGKTYLVDLDSRASLEWHHVELGQLRNLDCVCDVVQGGYLPLELLALVTS